jgi:hypothetical protein
VDFKQHIGVGDRIEVLSDPYVGKVERYARLIKGGEVLRIGLCRFYRKPADNAVLGTDRTGKLYKFFPVYDDPADNETWTDDSRTHPFPVELAQIDAKVVQLDLPPTNPDHTYHMKVCIPYSFRSMV